MRVRVGYLLVCLSPCMRAKRVRILFLVTTCRNCW